MLLLLLFERRFGDSGLPFLLLLVVVVSLSSPSPSLLESLSSLLLLLALLPPSLLLLLRLQLKRSSLSKLKPKEALPRLTNAELSELLPPLLPLSLPAPPRGLW